MVWRLGGPVQRSGRSSSRHSHVRVTPSRAKPRVPIHVFGIEVASHQAGIPPPKQAVRSGPISGREGDR